MIYHLSLFFTLDCESIELQRFQPFAQHTLDSKLSEVIERCKIPKDRVHLENQIGKGNFGVVYRGQLITPAGNIRTVAIKSLKSKLLQSM